MKGAKIPKFAKMSKPLLATLFAATSAMAWGVTREDFSKPPLQSRPAPIYWLNDVITNDVVDNHLANLKSRDGYGGVAILPQVEWEQPEFLDKYGHLLKKLDELGMWAIFCDDKSFPSGSAAGQMANYPQYNAREVYKAEEDVAGPATYQTHIGSGTLLGCVAMNNKDHSQRMDLSASVSGSILSWNVPAGSWKVMVFTCRISETGRLPVVDYLNPEAVAKWVELTYQRFYQRFPGHFGTTIKSSFFDDVGYAQASAGQWTGADHPEWTDSFNARFSAKYGLSPALYYPALWYDIGPGTASARALMFGFRSELFATGFVKVVADWCGAHGIDASGHPPNAYNPQSMEGAGDVMKFWQYAQRPLIDWIFGYGRGKDGMKLAGDAGFIYDHPIVQSECYGAIWDFTPKLLYRIAMDLYARGINQLVPHAAWYTPGGTAYVLPELSWRNPEVAPLLPGYCEWAGRCQLLLQGGRHVADIAVLYPINSIYADSRFGAEATSSDYLNVGERLSNRIRRDFTFLHPDVLDNKVTVSSANRVLELQNTVNPERFKVLVIPGGSHSGIINVSTMEKAKALFDSGGVIICTANLPRLSVEPGQDAKVATLSQEIFGLDPANPGTAFHKNASPHGGAAYFLPNMDEAFQGTTRLAAVLCEAVPVADVKFESSPVVTSAGGSLNYIHKVKDGGDIYFFSNSSDDPVDTWVRLRGKLTPELWNPHQLEAGQARFCVPEFSNTVENSENVTRIRLRLPPLTSVFITAH